MINSLTLTDFRNHLSSRIQTACSNVIITGPNGSGKTAVLEAISTMSASQSMRAAQMSDMTRIGKLGFAVFANLSDDTDVSVSWSVGDTSRKVTIDGDNASLSRLANILRIVWISPKEDRLFVDSASDRRAFFDRMVAGFDPAHLGRVSRLSKLLSERAFVLKSGADDNWLRPIDTELAGTATAVACARIKYAGEINFFLAAGSEFARHNVMMGLNGWFEDRLNNGGSPINVEQEYLNYLSQNKTLTSDKMVIDGAHKSDFDMFNDTLQLPVSITSTGQQKSALLSMMIAHAKLIKSKCGISPIILLDEAVAHLDNDARHALFAELGASDAQVWVTGIDRAAFDGIENAVFVTCQNGAINSMIKT